jgi:hypothetical protein
MHIGTLAVTFGGWMLIGRLSQSVTLTAGWLVTGMAVFVHLPSKERIK